jgi:hypothetical protein
MLIYAHDKSISVFVNFTTVYTINNDHNHFFNVTYSLSFCYFLEQRECLRDTSLA